jgi:hypothetical protein
MNLHWRTVWLGPPSARGGTPLAAVLLRIIQGALALFVGVCILPIRRQLKVLSHGDQQRSS